MSWRRFASVLAVTLVAAPAAAQDNVAELRVAWNQPAAPFTILGNVHYVGTAQIAAYLVTSPEGHVLIDGAMEESADQIAANIRALGFRVEDVRWLLANHAHWDHVGGLAALKRLTGARLAAGAGDAPDLERGANSDRDDIAGFPSVTVDRRLADGDVVEVGPVALTAHATPGHTRGCTSWSMPLSSGGRDIRLLFACSLTVAGARLVGNERYPEVVADFGRTYAALRALDADVFLGFHTAGFGFDDKRRRLAGGDPLAFVDPAELDRQLDRAEAAFRAELARQQAEAAAGRQGRDE